ncbi:agglutinin-like protein, partial [Suhomyces tanzawaensis NRRL Y-17324]
MKFLNIVAIAGSLAIATGKQVSGIFKSLDSVVYQLPPGSFFLHKTPGSPTWFATLSWEMDDSLVFPGDTFTLTMPYVFKFITSATSVSLTANGETFATCSLEGGELLVPFSLVKCTASDAIGSRDLLGHAIVAMGTIQVPFVFNNGGSSESVDLEGANGLVAGENTITFRDGDNELSTIAVFEGGSNSGNPPNALNFNSKVLPGLNLYQLTMLGGVCPDGYASGTIGLTVEQTNIDCETVKVGFTNDVNDFLFPKTYTDDFQFEETCSSTGYTVTYSNIPAGYRPFLGLLSDNPVGSFGPVTHYVDRYTCNSGQTSNNDETRYWGRYQNSDPNSDGGRVRIITLTYRGSTTALTTLPFTPGPGNTRTVVVQVPVPTTTVTSSWTGLVTTTITQTAEPGETATVIIEVPYPVVTITTPWTGTDITSVTVTGTDGTNTLVIETPIPTVTITTPWTGTDISTTTATGNGTNTVIIETP